MRSSIRTLGVFQQPSGPPGPPDGAAPPTRGGFGGTGAFAALGTVIAFVLLGTTACSGPAHPASSAASALSVVGDPPTAVGSSPAFPASTAPSPSTTATPTPIVPPTTDPPTTTPAPAPPRTTAGPPPAGGPPRVVSFTIRQAPTCLGPEQPGRDLVLAWTVAGAKGAELSEDTPGMPGSYNPGLPAAGSMALGFACDGGGGTTEMHVFDLYAAESDMNQAPYAELDVAAMIPVVAAVSSSGDGA